ncbi:MAG TPA: glutamine synthetase, partial [Gemmatimonadales bacterium]|nr:glutamine synthetase [Gemmatimonadales bacterium]
MPPSKSTAKRTPKPAAATPGATPAATPADVVRRAQEAGVQVVDVRFTDLPGTWQHFSLPVGELSEALFREGI